MSDVLLNYLLGLALFLIVAGVLWAAAGLTVRSLMDRRLDEAYGRKRRRRV